MTPKMGIAFGVLLNEGAGDLRCQEPIQPVKFL